MSVKPASSIIEKASSLDHTLAICLEYKHALMDNGNSRKKSRTDIEGVDKGKCWDDSHNVAEMDRECTPGYPYS